MTKRTIAVFTGNRAEYGLQVPILRAIDAHPELDYRLLVSGAHLDSNFGRTLQEIKADGFTVHAEVKIEMDAASALSTPRAIGSGVLAMSRELAEIKPDVLVVYADRFEGFAAVIAGTQMNIATAHIEGGDLTEGGALDDSVRHAMTKLSHLHFTTNDQATNRILAMGEEAWRVHTVGFPAIDLIEDGKFASQQEIVETLKLDLKRPVVLFTQHSVTTEVDSAAPQTMPSIEALRALADEGAQIVMTYPNNDAGGAAIAGLLEQAAAEDPRLMLRRSLGRHMYHGVLALARLPGMRVVCAGNSSSGIKETPAFGCPTVNIGSRQSGRLRGDNVLDADYDAAAITAALRRSLFDDQFRQQAKNGDNPYWRGGAGERVARILATVPVDQRLLRKQMTLLGETRDGWFR
jgi:UDP-N-acetylglucosamine 2-epimerase (non-hydrolysing)/GDP/UDP-N,N'-diacetylbacillosamine 2-epimerase (hydrolysing)